MRRRCTIAPPNDILGMGVECVYSERFIEYIKDDEYGCVTLEPEDGDTYCWILPCDIERFFEYMGDMDCELRIPCNIACDGVCVCLNDIFELCDIREIEKACGL